MATKAAKLKKTTTKAKQDTKAKAKPKTKQPPASKSAKGTRVPTDWAQLKKMWEAGESYEAMAKATDVHYDPQKADATKATRAKVCRARKQGVRIDGKLVRFGARGKAKTEKKVASAKGKGGQGKGKGKAGRNTAKPTHDHHETSPANQGREGRRSA